MKKLNNNEIVSFCSQLAMMFRAGIPLAEGVSIMREDCPPGEGKEILEKIYENLEIGELLHVSLRETEVFPDYVCNMTEVGERSGCLDEVLEGLAQHYENEEAIADSLKSSLTYPVIMLGMMLAVVVILVMKVMPVFDEVFRQLGGGLTGISKNIMDIGYGMNRCGLFFGILLAIIIFLIFYLVLTEHGRSQLHLFLQNFRLTRGIADQLACARVADCMALCVRSGLDLDEGLEMAERLVDNAAVKERVTACRKALSEGESFDEAAAKSHLFSGVYGRMITVGVHAGSVEQVMTKVARYYEDDAAEKMQGVVSVIEPTMVAVLSCTVGLILLSVILPLINIMANIG